MRTRLNLVVMTVLLAGPQARAELFTVDFEDLPLPTASSANSTSGGFTSRGVSFVNTFGTSQGFPFWTDWAYSNQRDVETAGFSNQFSVYDLVTAPTNPPNQFAIASAFLPNDAYIELPQGTSPISMRVANTTYAALSMLLGDSFAKKFGGPNGTDPDFFRLIVTGYSSFDVQTRTGAPLSTGPVTFYLADYTGTTDSLLSTWATVDLTGLAGARFLGFALESSDVGQFGTNTPTYFALDNLVLSAVPEPSAIALLGVGALALLGASRRGWSKP